MPWKKILRRTGLALALAVLGAQLVRPEKNLGPADGPADLFSRFEASAEIRQLFHVACYDCHSNRTRYPWYAEIQPLGWWLAAHVKDGKSAVNFTSLGELSAKRQKTKLEASLDQIETKTMPLPSYTITHADARLTPQQITTLVTWLEACIEKLEAAE